MKVRQRRHSPRSLMANRGGGWGWVRYERKRAYDAWGHHEPIDALGIVRTAQIQQATARMKERQRTGETRSMWELSTPEEVLADIRALFATMTKELTERPMGTVMYLPPEWRG